MGSSIDEGPDTTLEQGVAPQVTEQPIQGWPTGYTLEASLPVTGQGQVYRARHPDGQRVAIKRVPVGDTRELLESHALQNLQLPGVARLIDEQISAVHRWLITAWVDGRPFPGRSRAMSWAALEPIVDALLVVLGQVHARGYVHRDLKPGNVMVGADGELTVLDFGLAWAVDGPGITEVGQILGTPAYLAPEQLGFSGESPQPATDLWAVGVMIYEALTGELPFSRVAWHERLNRRAPRLASRQGIDAPLHVCEQVDLLLNPRVSDRPHSTEAVRRGLSQAQAPFKHPWLGRREVIEQGAARLLAGQGCRLIGAQGTGRTRVLEEIAQILAEHGRRVFWISPASDAAPLSNLDELIGEPPSQMGLDELVGWCVERLQPLLNAGLCVLADDQEALPSLITRVLDPCRASGAVISTHLSGEGIRISPLQQADLRGWFSDPERILKLPSRASEVLYRGTAGRPRLIATRLESWRQAGLISPDGDRWSIRSTQVAELALLAPPLLIPGPPCAHGDVLAWLTLADGALAPSELARAMGWPLWRLEAAVADLQAEGAVVQAGERPVVLNSGHLSVWSPEQRAHAHLALAGQMSDGVARVRQLWLGSPADAVPALLRLAERCLKVGRLETARAACDIVLRHRARRSYQVSDEMAAHLIRLLTVVALVDGRRRIIVAALEKVEAHGLSRRSPERLLLRHFAGTVDGSLPVSVADLDAMEDEPPELAPYQVAARFQLADRMGRLQVEADALMRMADQICPASGEATRARLAYRGNAFAESERLYLNASRLWTDPVQAAEALSRAASSALEAGFPDRARAHVLRAHQQTHNFEHPHLSGRLAWLERAAAHRLRTRCHEASDLLEACVRLGVKPLTSLVLMAECGLAWQRGDRAGVQRLASQAEAIFAYRGLKEFVHLMHAVQLAAGDTRFDGGPLMAAAIECKVAGVGIQIAGLVAEATPVRPEPHEVNAMVAGVPQHTWQTPMDLISVSEALARLADG